LVKQHDSKSVVKYNSIVVSTEIAHRQATKFVVKDLWKIWSGCDR